MIKKQFDPPPSSLSSRLDFSIMFENESMGVFQLLEMACLELAKVATRRGTGQARMYTRFVFCRMMWGELWTALGNCLLAVFARAIKM